MVQQGLYQSHELRQEQVIAPQQIQSLEILTAPLLDLQTRINQEMEENPALERLNSECEQLAGDPLEEMSATTSDNEENGSKVDERDELLANLMQLDNGYRDYLPPEHARSYNGPEDEEKRQYFFDSLTTSKTLQDELLEQLRTSEPDEDTHRIGELIIGSIDDGGYFRATIEEISTACQASLTRVKAVLRLIQSFEPPGVGAADIRECLLLQLERQGRKNTLAYKVVDKYLPEIGRNRIPEVARSLRVSAVSLYEVIHEIKQLQPRPGHISDPAPEQYVLPEAFVEQDEEDENAYKVSTNGDHIPRIRVSPLYIKLLEDKDTPADVRDYIKSKVVNGNALIKSIAQRQSTIHRIAEILVQRQRAFFDEGEERMKPLTMSQVADEIGVHETTVSRAIANKYIQTPRGLFPFKHFFSTGYQSDSGDMLSSLSIKTKIQALISEEDAGKPLSDQKIVKLLQEQGLKVARRTVAKYREELGISSSHLRKSYGI